MNKRKNSITIAIILAIVVFLGGAFLLSRNSNSPTVASNRVSTTSTVKATATATVNRGFDFKAINQAKEQKDIKYTITVVERKDEIKVKDVSRKAAADRDYLLVRIEIENNNPERLALAPSDFIRLETDGKLFAPDYHNGNVILDPISVKRDIVSFVVPRNQKQFVFQVGELSSNKEKIEVNF